MIVHHKVRPFLFLLIRCSLLRAFAPVSLKNIRDNGLKLTAKENCLPSFALQVPTIIMTTGLEENGKKKCSEYWPTKEDEPMTFEGEDGEVMVVKCIRSTDLGFYTETLLEITADDLVHVVSILPCLF
jgi:hypothetical protein